MDSADSGWLTNLWMSALIGTNGDAGNEWMNTMYPTDYNTPEVIEQERTSRKCSRTIQHQMLLAEKYDPMATHFFNGRSCNVPERMIPVSLRQRKLRKASMTRLVSCFSSRNGMEMVPTPGDMVGYRSRENRGKELRSPKFETTRKPDSRLWK